MRKSRFFILIGLVILSLFFVSCSKDSSTEPPDNGDDNTEFYGSPFINPSAIFSNEATDITIRVSLSANPNLVDNGVNLVRVDANDNVIEAICQLYDDGDLAHGDEIGGDNVYSVIHSFNEAAAGTNRFRVAATSSVGGNEIVDYSPVILLIVVDNNNAADYNVVSVFQNNMADNFEDNLNGSDIESALEDTYNWVLQQAGVESAELIDNGVSVVYENGISGGIMVYQENENGDIVIKGGGNPPARQYTPLNQEITTPGRNSVFAPRDTEENKDVIGNGNFLIWAPFENVFNPDMAPSLQTIIGNSEYDISVTYINNTDCSVSSLNNLTDYGVVIFDSHGNKSGEIGTGEQVTNWTFALNYINLLLGRVSIWSNIKVGYSGNVVVRQDLFAITPAFIEALPGTFQNSLIFAGTCFSSYGTGFQNAFINKGAQTYFGFDRVVHEQFCRNMCDDLISDMLIDFKTTGEAFTPGQTDPMLQHALFEMEGNENLHFSLELINGDFEFGNLTGWSRSGDGRVITQLVYMTPTQGSFMGIISTGLGYTEDSGSLYQTFRVPQNNNTLTFKWNFLSEELLEYVGSIYQDYFKVTIIDSEDYETTVFYVDVDEIDADYGPYLVSPDIVFDVGDVYATGWNTYTYSLSSWANEIVTIRFSAGDVGDSAFDTAILLDEIAVGQ